MELSSTNILRMKYNVCGCDISICLEKNVGRAFIFCC